MDTKTLFKELEKKKEERDGRRVIQAEAARAMGVPATTYAAWLRGQMSPREEKRVIIARFFAKDEKEIPIIVERLRQVRADTIREKREASSKEMEGGGASEWLVRIFLSLDMAERKKMLEVLKIFIH